MAAVSGLFVYPIKSCRGIAVDEARAGARGFEHDRRLMVVDANGRFVTQRQFPQMALIEVESVDGGWRLSAPGAADFAIPKTFEAGADGAMLCTVRVWRDEVEATLAPPDINVWFSSVLGFACGLVYQDDAQHRAVTNAAAGFDDVVSFADGAPYLLISEASVAGLNKKLETLVTMTHFRPNIVVTADTPHAEDQWQRISLGEAQFAVAWPCSRCIMTTVNPQTGARRDDGEPMRTLKTYRQDGRAVYFGQNLLVRREGNVAVGDPVQIISS